MVSVRSRLREELTRRFVPLLRSRNFVGPESIVGSGLFHEFHRKIGPAVHGLCIQLDKYQRPRFVLNLSIEPNGRIEALIAEGGTVAQGRVQPRPGRFSRSWFRADYPWWHRPIGKNGSLEGEAVSQALAMFDEMETWWHSQASSAHIVSRPIVFPGR